MRCKKIISAVLAASVAFSCVFTVYADSSAADIKSYILLSTGKNPAGAGKMSVLDLCRIKRDIIEGRNTEVSDSLIKCGDIRVDYNERKVYVPVLLSENSFGVDAVRTLLKYDHDYFTFSEIAPGTIPGGFRYSPETSMVMYSNDYDFDNDGGGILYYYVIDMENYVPEGAYSFSLYDIAAASYRINENGENLTADQCSAVSPVVKVNISSSGNVITEPQEGHYSDYPGLDAQTVQDKIMAYKEIYPDGTPWTNEITYRWKGSPTIGAGCAAFAFMLSDAAFGTLPARRHNDVSSIKTGDIIRVNNDSHSVIVTKVTENGVVVAEGNMNSAVLWGRKFSWSELERITTFIWTRYPE